MAGSNKQTQTNAVDPGTARWIEAYRQQAASAQGPGTGLGQVQDYMNPYQQNVVQGIQTEGNRQLGLVNNQAASMATAQGAYGGSREAVLRAQMANDVNRNTQNAVANANATGYQNALGASQNYQQMQANFGLSRLGAMQGGFTPTSQTMTQEQQQSLWPQLLGAATGIGGMLLGGPAGGAAAKKIAPWG